MPTNSNCPPMISIGMPVFNCAKTIEQAITSILNQSFQDWELLIVDDGSTDDTLDIALSFNDPRIIVTQGGGNQRIAKRLNECVRRAKGKFFARMDGDDIAYPTRLEVQIGYLRNHPEVDLVAGWVMVFRNDGTALGARRGLLTHEQIFSRRWKGVLMPHSTWLGKIEWFRDNPYWPNAVPGEDQELLFRTYHKSRFATVPDVVLGYREDRLCLRYLLRQRRRGCRHIVLNAVRQGRLADAALCVAAETAKGLTEAFAIGAGLNHRMLRRRAMPIQRDELLEWQSVWQEVICASEKHRLDIRTVAPTQAFA